MVDPARTRVVLPREMFFSLTDERGVITGANSVFSRIARFSHDELLGAPHSLVRNPLMPAGVFRLMWDVIQAGRPFAGYVLNKAADDVPYWVFATVTPVPGGFLSVRTAPCVTEIWIHAASLYEKVLAREKEERAKGANRRAVGEFGRNLVLEGLAGLGFPSYEDFMLQALPAEVLERGARAGESQAESAVVDPTLEYIREAGKTIGREASGLLTQLDKFRELGRDLQQASLDASQGARNLANASASARVASEVVADAAPAVLSTARAMESGGRSTLSALEALAAQLDRDQKLLRGLQIRIALVKLHSDMVISFVDDLLSGGDAREGIDYLPQICHALESTVRLLADALAAHTKGMRDVGATIDTISEGLSQFQSFLFMWRNLLIRHGVSSDVTEHLAPIDRQLSAGSAQIVTLRELARRCLAETRPYDSGPMMNRVKQLAEAGELVRSR